MAKGNSVVDVLVLGGHPSAYLASALLKNKTKFEVMHSCIPGEPSGDGARSSKTQAGSGSRADHCHNPFGGQDRRVAANEQPGRLDPGPKQALRDAGDMPR